MHGACVLFFEWEFHMKIRHLSLVVLVLGFCLSAGAQKQDGSKKWICTVPSDAQLISYRYTGGNWADIHIAPFQSGGSYRIAKKDDTMVTGTTENGTPFTCKQE